MIVIDINKDLENLIPRCVRNIGLPENFSGVSVGYIAASDPGFQEMRSAKGQPVRTPRQFFPGAESVICICLKLTEKGVRDEQQTAADAAAEGRALDDIPLGGNAVENLMVGGFFWTDEEDDIYHTPAERALDRVNDEVSQYLEGTGFRAYPIPCAGSFDTRHLTDFWSNEAAAAYAGLGTVREDGVFVTPDGAECRCSTVITGARLVKDAPIEEW